MNLSINQKCYRQFCDVIHQLTGITIAADRTTLVEGRVRRRIRSLELNSYEEYLHLVQNDPSEQKTFIDLITTNETYFFRTPRIWSYLYETFLPDWYGRNSGRTLKVWSAAASSGEESHSLGVLCEAFKSENSNFRFQILGTDISRKMIKLCDEGVYSGRSLRAFRDTKPEWFETHMRAISSTRFRVTEQIKSRLRFRVHNLFQPLNTADRFDLVLLRNVLIYFSGTDQEEVVSLIAPRLAEDGILVIGESESLAHIETGFSKKTNFVYEASRPTAAAIESVV